MVRVVASLTILVVLTLGTPMDGAAQQAAGGDEVSSQAGSGRGEGRAVIVDWPASLGRLLDEMGRKAPYLLPKIDTLALDYRYATTEASSQWSFVLGWTPGAQVLYEGVVLPRRRTPRGLRMVNLELRAEMRADGRDVGDMIVAVDSMALAPSPSFYSFEVTVPHNRVLLDVSADTARRALRRGATLHNLVVERVGFAATSAE